MSVDGGLGNCESGDTLIHHALVPIDGTTWSTPTSIARDLVWVACPTASLCTAVDRSRSVVGVLRGST